MRKSERLADGPPALLQKLYGSDQVLCLRDFLLRLCESSPDVKHVLEKRLLQPYDHREYSKLVLSDVLCIVDRGAQLPSSRFTLAQVSSQVQVSLRQFLIYDLTLKSPCCLLFSAKLKAPPLRYLQLLHRAIEALLHSPNGKNNVICYGYRRVRLVVGVLLYIELLEWIGPLPMQKRPSAGGRQLLGSSSTEMYHHNAISDSLLTSPWELLLSRIGDTLMLYLFLHVTMFRRLPNGCCLQLTGPPAQDKVRNFRRYKSIPNVTEHAMVDQDHVQNKNCSVEKERDEMAGEPALKRRKITPLTIRLTYKTQDYSNQPLNRGDGSTEMKAKEGEKEMGRTKSRTRPSSWQRRKTRRCLTEKDESIIPPTQPAVSIEAEWTQKQQPNGTSDCRNAPAWPQYLPKFADMYIPRSPVFYSAGYPSKPGFPKKRKSFLSYLNRDDQV